MSINYESERVHRWRGVGALAIVLAALAAAAYWSSGADTGASAVDEDVTSMGARSDSSHVRGAAPNSQRSPSPVAAPTEAGRGGEIDSQPAVATAREHAVLDEAAACVAALPTSDTSAILACLELLEWEVVTPQGLGRWVCESSSDFLGVSMVTSARVRRLSPRSVCPFLVDFQAQCSKYRETGLLTGAIASARAVSELWYQEFAVDLLEHDWALPDGGETLIQLAEVLVESGDPRALARVEDFGRGLLGGDSRQVHRAALIAVVHSPDAARRLSYLQSVYASAGARGEDLGNLLGEFLSQPACWPQSDARPALTLLIQVLQDLRFAAGAAAQLSSARRSAPAGADAEWRSVQQLVEAAMLAQGR